MVHVELDRVGTTFTQVAQAYWPVLLISFAVSLIVTPLCCRIALSRGIVDQPDQFLKPHGKPVPYLGGAAIFAGWAAGVLLALFLFDRGKIEPNAAREGPTIVFTMMLGILIAGLAALIIGLLDDLRSLSPRAKLIGITLVTVLLIAVGLGNDSIVIALRASRIRLTELDPWLVLIYSVPLTLLITLGACNATNLIDGLDGLCSGVLGIISAGFLILSVHLHLWNQWNPLDVQRVVLSLAMMGAALGFLPYNRNPAKIFMGDAGSMFLGLNAAVLILLFSKSAAIRWFLASLMVFGLPITDTVLTLVRRWRHQKPLMQGDRSHFYDQLVDRGWSVRRVVRVSYGLAAFFALMGCISITLRTRYIIPLYGLVVVLTMGIIKRHRMLRVDRATSQTPP